MGDETTYPAVMGTGCLTGMLWSFVAGDADPKTKKGWKNAALGCAGSAANSGGIFWASDRWLSRDTAWKLTGGWWGIQGLAGFTNWLGRKQGWENEPLHNAVSLPLNFAAAPIISTVGLIYGASSYALINDPNKSIGVYGGMLVFRTNKSVNPIPGFHSDAFTLGAVANGVHGKITRHELGHMHQFSIKGGLGKSITFIGSHIPWLIKGADKKKRYNVLVEQWADNFKNNQRTTPKTTGLNQPLNNHDRLIELRNAAFRPFSTKEKALLEHSMRQDLDALIQVLESLEDTASYRGAGKTANDPVFAADLKTLSDTLNNFSDSPKKGAKVFEQILTFFGKNVDATRDLTSVQRGFEFIRKLVFNRYADKVDKEIPFTKEMERASQQLRHAILDMFIKGAKLAQKKKVNALLRRLESHTKDKTHRQRLLADIAVIAQQSNEARQLLLDEITNRMLVGIIPHRIAEDALIALGQKKQMKQRRHRQGWSVGGAVSHDFTKNENARSERIWVSTRNYDATLEIRLNALAGKTDIEPAGDTHWVGGSVEPVFHLIRDPKTFDPYLAYEVGVKHLLDTHSTHAFGAMGPGLQIELENVSLHGGIKVGAETAASGLDATLQGTLGLSYQF